jgi:hypothetical protein
MTDGKLVITDDQNKSEGNNVIVSAGKVVVKTKSGSQGLQGLLSDTSSSW